ncbi:ATP-binding cassette domain-containing protein [Gammaproteobacteria bacterium]|nr:ATP-binding cassette domain-containing protein [Gammaproteobacteria bacterium]
MTSPVLDVRRLSVSYQTGRGTLRALRNVNMTVQPGRIVGIVGESGCGKSTLISTIIRLLAPNARIDGGSIEFMGRDLLSLESEAMRALRGDGISMVFQDPMTSLNPVMTIGRQMTDIQHRDNRSRADKLARAARLLERVGIADPAEQLKRYPHHLSGGMRQRVAIAMALMTEPALLIADEPTTALDATLEVQIIHRLRQLQQDFGCAVLFISHHLGVIAELCDEVVVMYAGEVVETGSTREVFLAPRHPYTRKLLECDPGRIEESTRHLPVIAGKLPDLVDLPKGCVFRSRCDESIDICARKPPELEGDDHCAACHVVGQ